jgi:membrane protein required for colicin V production
MNYVDLILGILLILSAINGFSKGFVEELAGLVALILGIWAAIHFSDAVGQYLTENFHWTFKHLSIVAFIITFLIVVILVQIIGSFFSKLVKAVSLGFLNRLAGLAFGALKGALILSILLVIFDKLDKDVHLIAEKTKAESRLYTPVRNFAPGVFPFLDFWKEDK